MTDPDKEMAREIFTEVAGASEKAHGCVWTCTEQEYFEELIIKALRSVRQAENVDPEQVNELMKTLAPSLSSFERNFCAYKLTERLNKGDLRHNRLKEKP